MANLIGTETIAKGSLYQRIKDLMVSVGWQNISSNTATDFDVMYSTGEAGDKTLYVNLKDLASTATTTGQYIGMRFVNKYIPGTTGVAGTFDRTSVWYNVYFTTLVLATDTQVSFSYQVNKDRIVFAIDPPLACFNAGNGGNIAYIGSPILFETEPNCRSLTLAQATCSSTQVATGFLVVNSPPHIDGNAVEVNTSYKMTTPGEFNNSDKRILSDISYGNANNGIRGKFDGFFAMDGGWTRTSHGDILTDGTSTYKVIKVFSATGLLFSDTTMYAFQIS